MFKQPDLAAKFLYPSHADEGFRRNAEKLRLRFVNFEPHSKPQATIILSGGLNEFTEKYLHRIAEFNALGYNVISINFADQGGSDLRLPHKPDRRHVEDFEKQEARDLLSLTKYLTAPREPVFYIGHSMGALIGTLAAKIEPRAFTGMVLSTPFWGFQHWAARMIGERNLARTRLDQNQKEDFALAYKGPWVPRSHVKSDFPPHAYSHDLTNMYLQDHWSEINPELRSRPVTKGFVRAASTAIVSLRRPGVLESITTPMLVMSAGDDKIVNTRAIFNMSARLSRAQHVSFRTARHELFMEDDANAPIMPIIHSFIQQYRR